MATAIKTSLALGLDIRLLTQDAIDAAARLAYKATTWYHECGPEPDTCPLSILGERMENATTQSGPVVITGFRDENLVGIYVLPLFARKNNSIISDPYGKIATNPEGEGIGGKILFRLADILAVFASDCNVREITHHVQTRRSSPLYERRGYLLTHTIDVGDRYAFHNYVKKITAGNPLLSPGENEIVKALADRIR